MSGRMGSETAGLYDVAGIDRNLRAPEGLLFEEQATGSRPF